MKFDNTDVWGFKHAIRGMRNPLESWWKSDSLFALPSDRCIIGDNDKDLMMRLIESGPEHRKFLRQIMVSVDITAPLYWWKEFDTYKVGTTANSTSTMHTLSKTPITIDCFETDDINANGMEAIQDTILYAYIPMLEDLRKKYIETRDYHFWKELVRWLPESWLQTRTVTMNYENVYNMVHQRINHKLNEWSGQNDSSKTNFIQWAKGLPYADTLIFHDVMCSNYRNGEKYER